MTAQVGQSVAVLGVCSDGCISATPHGVAVQKHETEEEVVSCLLGRSNGHGQGAPTLRRVGGLWGLGLCRTDFSSSYASARVPPGAVWMPAAQALQRDVWAAGHFQCLVPLGLTEVQGEEMISKLFATTCSDVF